MTLHCPVLLRGDVNDDGAMDISDAVYLLEYLFLGTRSELPPPFPGIGVDTTPDRLFCAGLHPNRGS